MGKSSKQRGHKLSRPYNPRNVQVYKPQSESQSSIRNNHTLGTSDSLARNTRQNQGSLQLPSQVKLHAAEVTEKQKIESSNSASEENIGQQEELIDTNQDSHLFESNGVTMQEQEEQGPQPQEELANAENEEISENDTASEAQADLQDEVHPESEPALENTISVEENEQNSTAEGNQTPESSCKGKSPKQSPKSSKDDIFDYVNLTLSNEVDPNSSSHEGSVVDSVSWLHEKSEEDVVIEDQDEECPPTQLLNGDDFPDTELNNTENNCEYIVHEPEENGQTLNDVVMSVNETENFLSAAESPLEVIYHEEEEEEDDTGSVGKLTLPESSSEVVMPTVEGSAEISNGADEKPLLEDTGYSVMKDHSRSFAGNIRSISSRRPVRNSTFAYSKRENSVEQGSVSSKNSDGSSDFQVQFSRSTPSSHDPLQTDSNSSVEYQEGSRSVPVKRKADADTPSKSKKQKITEVSRNILTYVYSPLRYFRNTIRYDSIMGSSPRVCAAESVENCEEGEDKTVGKAEIKVDTEKTIASEASSENTQNNPTHRSWCNVM